MPVPADFIGLKLPITFTLPKSWIILFLIHLYLKVDFFIKFLTKKKKKKRTCDKMNERLIFFDI